MLDKVKLLEDYKIRLHKYLGKATSDISYYSVGDSKHKYAKGTTQALLDCLFKLDILDIDVDGVWDVYQNLVYQELDNINQEISNGYHNGLMYGYSYALIILDRLKNKNKYK